MKVKGDVAPPFHLDLGLRTVEGQQWQVENAVDQVHPNQTSRRLAGKGTEDDP